MKRLTRLAGIMSATVLASCAAVGLSAAQAHAVPVQSCSPWQAVPHLSGFWQKACLVKDGSNSYAYGTVTNTGSLTNTAGLEVGNSADFGASKRTCPSRAVAPGQSFSCSTPWTLDQTPGWADFASSTYGLFFTTVSPTA
ncbi:hypothetical protein [Streptomyces sp. SAS_272]|uniref:hypothetical protein n=1 Tax=Streptomyces sp. SAS_272 TaxID=3412747 RepID=UPI00403C7599